MKNTIQKVLSYVLVAAIASGTTLLCCFFDMRNDQPSKLQELQAIVEYYFIGEADTYAMEEAAASAMIEALKDRWSFYMSAEEYLGYQDTMANSYVGVGVTVQVRKDGTGLDVISVSANGPAESAGILSGDVLIAGDTLFAGSCGRTDFPGGSGRKILKSLRRLAELEGNPAVLPGHMETSSLDVERRRNPFVLQALRSSAE